MADPARGVGAAGRDGRVLVSGLDLLVHQAALQFELFTGLPADAAWSRPCAPPARVLAESTGDWRIAARLVQSLGSGHGLGGQRRRGCARRPVSAASAVLVPRIIERVPEPEPDEEPDGGETPAEHIEQPDDSTDPTESTEPGAAPTVEPAETMPVRAAEQAPAAQPAGQPTAARVVGPGKEPADEPKELYAAIADAPGLLWRCILAGASPAA